MTYAGAYTVALRRIAIVRGVPDSFADALVMGESPTIDVGRAREQHSVYVQFLADNGYELRMLEADGDHPDCPFVEDVVVVLDSVAALTRPGAESRRGEVAAMAAELDGVRRLRKITEPGTLDGGDVLRLGDTIYVGDSARTNREGIRQLTEIAGEDGLRVIAVPVSGVLHLKSAVARLDDDTVLLAPDCVDPDFFADYRIVEKVSAEAHLASVLSLDGGGLAMTTTAPLTLQRLQAAGYDPALVDSSEFQAADGGLTCLSVLVDRVE